MNRFHRPQSGKSVWEFRILFLAAYGRQRRFSTCSPLLVSGSRQQRVDFRLFLLPRQFALWCKITRHNQIHGDLGHDARMYLPADIHGQVFDDFLLRKHHPEM